MATDKIELRGMCPAELAQALDAIAMAKSMDRNAYVNEVLLAHVKKYIDELNVVTRTMRGNTLLSETDGKA